MTEICPTCPHEKKHRSLQDHRRLMGIISAAFDQWPEQHQFSPNDAEHLRAWLICKAGPEFRTVTTFEVSDADAKLKEQISEIVRGRNTFPGWHGSVLYKVEPKSMSFRKMGQKEFGRLREAIEDVIFAEVGVPASQLLKEAEHAA